MIMENHIVLLSHAVKSVLYRFDKVTMVADPAFGTFSINDHTRTPSAIVNHMNDLSVKTVMMIREGHFSVPAPTLLDFTGEVFRLRENLQLLYRVIDLSTTDIHLSEKLLQGPILDMCSHVGQLAMLSGLYGKKIGKESYFDAEI